MDTGLDAVQATVVFSLRALSEQVALTSKQAILSVPAGGRPAHHGENMRYDDILVLDTIFFLSVGVFGLAGVVSAIVAPPMFFWWLMFGS